MVFLSQCDSSPRPECTPRTADEIGRQIMEGANEGILVCDRELRYVAWNPWMEELTGVAEKELLGRRPYEVFPFLREQGVCEMLERVLNGESVPPVEHEYPTPGGARAWTSARFGPLRNALGEITGVIVTLQDITGRKRAEEALRASEERFRVALKNSPIMVFNQDRELRYTWLHNPKLAWAEIDPLGKTDAEVAAPADASRLTEIKQRVLETGVAAREQVELTFQGKQSCYDLTVEPLRDACGEISGITCACTDITALQETNKRLKLLLEVNQALVSKLDFKKLLPSLGASLRPVLNQDFVSISVCGADTRCMRVYGLDFLLAGKPSEAELSAPLEKSLAIGALKSHTIRFFDRADLEKAGFNLAQRLAEAGVQSLCCIPLENAGRALGTLNLASTRENAFTSADAGLLWQVAAQVAIALDNARAYREIAQLKEKLAREKVYLEDEIRTEGHFDKIIGENPALKQALAQVATVARTGATVLILGETGTGKELVARAIHRISARNANTFIKVNCAAIPTGLLESELFGHEKGAFTGALSQKIGRVELADKGTLFLDEVGDLAAELQPKLLRMLQDQEFERLGSTRTTRVDVRLIAATHQDLSGAAKEHKFRPDLFYRLNVFPVRLPPLRERRDDIPLLVRYFVQKYATRMNKKIDTIPSQSVAALQRWQWPGNVRELENFIERSVILTPGSVLRVPLAQLGTDYENGAAGPATLETAEREHIVRILRQTRGLISGPNGAAVRLGLKRTTLQSKIRRLGIGSYKNP